MAEMRARWEADRLYSPLDEAQKNLSHGDELTNKYEQQVLEKYHLSREQADKMCAEAHPALGNWPTPARSSADIEEWAKDISVTVYWNEGSLTCHRPGCELLRRDKAFTSSSLDQAAPRIGATSHASPAHHDSPPLSRTAQSPQEAAPFSEPRFRSGPTTLWTS